MLPAGIVEPAPPRLVDDIVFCSLVAGLCLLPERDRKEREGKAKTVFLFPAHV